VTQAEATQIAAMHNPGLFFNPFASWFNFAAAVAAPFVGEAALVKSSSTPMTQSHAGHAIFVPDTATSRHAPMLVMLHGAGQDPDDFAAGTGMNGTAQRHGFVVLYPAQDARRNAQRCWNWFEAAHQSRTQGEPATIASLTLRVAADLDIDASRIYVAGLSAGGAMAALLGELFPDVYAAVGVHSGLAPLAGTDLQSGLAAMRGAQRAGRMPSNMPTIVFHGDMDNVVNPINGTQVMEAACGSPAACEIRHHRGHRGRGYTRLEYLGEDESIRGEHWVVHDAGHAWSGGCEDGSYADPLGPDASEEMLRFFESHRKPADGFPVTSMLGA
jgi:poly(hydroxyalkanoate) depolymerase family esterase